MSEDHDELAWNAEERGDWFEAARQRQLALAEAPADPWMLSGLARALFELEQYDRARDAIERAVAIPGKHLQYAYWRQGKILRELGDYAAAVEAFKNQVRIKPDGLAYFYLGNTLELQGNREGALANYRAALELEPDNDEWLAHLGRCLAEDSLEEGLTFLQRAVTLDPNYGYIHEQLADVLSQMHRRDEALVHYRRAVELDPDLARIRVSLALELVLNFDGSDDQEAEEHFLRAIELDPTSSGPLRSYGVFLKTRGRIADAKQAFREALRVNPDDEDAAEWLSKIRSLRRKMR